LNTPPFDENWFWNELSGFGDGKKYLIGYPFPPGTCHHWFCTKQGLVIIQAKTALYYKQ